MKRLLLLTFFFALLDALETQAATSDCVVLLHGLARHSHSMRVMAKALVSEGYSVVLADYPSRTREISKLAELAIRPSITKCGDAETIHFVTHSLGGILVRQYVQQQSIDTLGRVVMLGPPNKGSEVVDFYSRWALARKFGGPAFLQLGTTPGISVPRQLGKVDFELGVIAGTRSLNPILSRIIPGKDDGKVSVKSTKVAGMQAHLCIPTSHPLMMRDKAVIDATKKFLRHGTF